jgi:integrase
MSGLTQMRQGDAQVFKKYSQMKLHTLRHVFCTRLSEVAPAAVVQRAMRHSSPETKRRYQLGMANQVRQTVEKANESAYGKGKRTLFLLRSASGGVGGTENRL